ncbi:MAG: ABC transporter permease [Chloroflexota bacterium]|nr:ABC transporter permease [Chloroflexota bacterium]
MATIAERRSPLYRDESWEYPQDKSFAARWAKNARDNPVGAVAFAVVAAFVVLGVVGPWIAPYQPDALDAKSQYLGPSTSHLFGTTKFGYDVFSRVLSGARIDLKFGIVIVLLGFFPGTALGIVSGYFGRWADYLIQRSAEAWTGFPLLILLLTFIAAFGPGLRTVELVIGISALFSGSRLLRVVALVEKHKEYVAAARSTGASEWRILYRHVLPNIMPFILVGLSSVFAIAVLLEATLSFLGLGVRPGEPSWGADLSIALRREAGDKHPWLIIFPGAAISLVILAFNLLGDTLRDVLDPRLRGSTGPRK